MANPNNAVGTNGAFGGRTSVNAFNDVANFWTAGRVSGWQCVPKSGLTVSLGGSGSSRDVALAQDPSGNKTTVNNISGAPVDIAVNAAPASNSRIDVIVAYIEDSPSGNGETDNPDVVNLLVVSGAVASTPTIPNDSAIRTAITADGASGSTAYYVVLASVTIPTGTTDIDSTMITQGAWAQLSSDHIMDGAITSDKVDFTTFRQLPTATISSTIAWNFPISLQRIGNIVFCTGTFVRKFTNNYDQEPFPESLPVGYRPITTQYVPFVCTTSDTGADGAYTFHPSGSGALSCRAQSVQHRYMYSAVWPTNDDWPS